MHLQGQVPSGAHDVDDPKRISLNINQFFDQYHVYSLKKNCRLKQYSLTICPMQPFMTSLLICAVICGMSAMNLYDGMRSQ